MTSRTRVRTLVLVLSLAAVCILVPHVRADEGMWPLNRFPTARLEKQHGFTPSPQWLEQARLGSVRLAGGCSGSFVSGSGLVMTNYHCVVACVEALSDEERNLMSDGFYARDPGDERQCPGMEVNQLLDITDVTNRVSTATAGTEGEQFRAARNTVFAAIEHDCVTGDDVRCDVVTLYRGGRYDLYRYRRFQDVRLVFVPEFDTGFFGGDPDNFMFPRYNLDLAFLRVYEAGVPLRPAHWLPWSPDGASAGDLVFVTGHPGSTSRLHTVAQLEFERDVRLPSNLIYLSELRGMLTEFQRRGPEQARVAGAQLVFIENSLKVMRGQFAALTDRALLERKRADEAALRRQIDAQPELEPRFGGAWDAIASAVDRRRELWPRFAVLSRLGGSELFGYALALVRLAEEQTKPNEQRLPEFRDAALPGIRQRITAARPHRKDFETVVLAQILTHVRERLGLDDPATKALLANQSPDEVATAAIAGTGLDDPNFRVALMNGGRDAVTGSTDPLIVLARSVDPLVRDARQQIENRVDAAIDRNTELIAQALFATRGDEIYPDATFTLRVTYGTVRGWLEGGREVTPFTTLAGLFDRHTGSPPFQLPTRWLERRAQAKLDTPFNLVADTDIIGGNSGSPMIDRAGRIVGLVFDGNIHSIGGEYGFDPSRNRTVAVDSRGIREALRAVYQADRVLAEIDAR